ncbi:hypothetical protein Mapa_007057 [Marchantia paleacea]|nr:hypothetical protein Mapa_007057 [Marchantia paleacea]
MAEAISITEYGSSCSNQFNSIKSNLFAAQGRNSSYSECTVQRHEVLIDVLTWKTRLRDAVAHIRHVVRGVITVWGWFPFRYRYHDIPVLITQWNTAFYKFRLNDLQPGFCIVHFPSSVYCRENHYRHVSTQ